MWRQYSPRSYHGCVKHSKCRKVETDWPSITTLRKLVVLSQQSSRQHWVLFTGIWNIITEFKFCFSIDLLQTFPYTCSTVFRAVEKNPGPWKRTKTKRSASRRLNCCFSPNLRWKPKKFPSRASSQDFAKGGALSPSLKFVFVSQPLEPTRTWGRSSQSRKRHPQGNFCSFSEKAAILMQFYLFVETIERTNSWNSEALWQN